MLSLHSLALFPGASASHSQRHSLTQASVMERPLRLPSFMIKDERPKRIKISAILGKDGEGRNETALPGEVELPTVLRRELMPKHVAVILDGSRRWAKKQGLSAIEGYKVGSRRLVDHALLSFKWGVKTFSAFAFSTENWFRPEDEVNYLMDTFERTLELERPTIEREDMKVSVIGNTTGIPKSLLRVKLETEEFSKHFNNELILAINYSGRYDILQACKSIAQKAKDDIIQAEDINENLMERELLTNCTHLPHPDLLIRTSGEQRVSNFYLWQLAYTELHFSPVLWPDFNEAAFIEALVSYQRRERRFGRHI